MADLEFRDLTFRTDGKGLPHTGVVSVTPVVFVVIVHDHHTDPEPFVFSTEEQALGFARLEASDWADGTPYDIEEHVADEWLYCATVGNEGDTVWVYRAVLDAGRAATDA